MPKTETIRARVDAQLKADAEAVLSELGLSSSDAIRLFYRQVTLRRGLPFDVGPNAETRRAIRDVERGRGLKTYKDAQEMFRGSWTVMPGHEGSFHGPVTTETFRRDVKRLRKRGNDLEQLLGSSRLCAGDKLSSRGTGTMP